MRAAEIMSRPVLTVGPDTPLREAIHLLVDNGFAGLPVVDSDDHVLGVLTEPDALAASMREDGLTSLVTDAMKRPVQVTTPDADTHEVVRRMLEDDLRCMPVVQQGELLGVISRRDLLRPLVRPDDAITAAVTRLFDDYTSHHNTWRVSSQVGAVTVAGTFRDDAERRVVEAIARTVPGVLSVQLAENSRETAAKQSADGG